MPEGDTRRLLSYLPTASLPHQHPLLCRRSIHAMAVYGADTVAQSAFFTVKKNLIAKRQRPNRKKGDRTNPQVSPKKVTTLGSR